VTPLLHVSLGDSFASGDGVGLHTPPDRTWAGLVAAAAGARFVPLARPGVPAAVVLRDQLPVAEQLRPDLAVVCLGLNDLFRSGGATESTGARIRVLVERLRAAGATVVVGRLHDPTRLVARPVRLARLVRAHVEAINASLDAVAHLDPGILLVDMSVLLERPECWAVDRLHPSCFGHRVLAAQAAARLRLPVDVALGPVPPAPTRAASWRWLIRRGVPWLAQRLPELATSTALRRSICARSSAPDGPVHLVGQVPLGVGHQLVLGVRLDLIPHRSRWRTPPGRWSGCPPRR
jgi:lysophospholipase L1-like esterase